MTRAPDLEFKLPRPLRGQIRVYEHVCTEHLAVFEDVILAEHQTRRGSAGSLNQGGWKSGELFAGLDRSIRGTFASADAAAMAFGALRDQVAEIAGHGAITGWAMINRADSHHPRHRHQGAALVGVYFVTTGVDATPTPTMFETPHAIWGDSLQIDPVAGRLVIFPGDLWHSVSAVAGEVPRITIAFDVRR